MEGCGAGWRRTGVYEPDESRCFSGLNGVPCPPPLLVTVAAITTMAAGNALSSVLKKKNKNIISCDQISQRFVTSNVYTSRSFFR